jgi:hypothetical protein
MKFLLLSFIHLNTHLALEFRGAWRGRGRPGFATKEARSWPALPEASGEHRGLTPVQVQV